MYVRKYADVASFVGPGPNHHNPTNLPTVQFFHVPFRVSDKGTTFAIYEE